MGSQRVGHAWATFTLTFICWAFHSPWCTFYHASEWNLLKTHLRFCQSSVLQDKVFPQLLKITVLDQQCLAGLTPPTSVHHLALSPPGSPHKCLADFVTFPDLLPSQSPHHGVCLGLLLWLFQAMMVSLSRSHLNVTSSESLSFLYSLE